MATALCVLTVIAYWPALRAGFVWDDDSFLTHNRLIRAGDGLWRLWFTAESADYWPVTSSMLWFEWRVWGMHAVGYHVVNLGLHLIEALLLWAILRRLHLPGSWLAALLFALHPVNVESVAWIAQRKNLLAMLFFLISLFAFLESEAEGGRKWRRASLAAFALAMLSKGSVAPLPLVLAGVIAWRRPVRLADLRRLVPYALIAVALAAVDVWFQKHGSGEVIRSGGLLYRLLGAAAAVAFYLGKALWPHPLAFVYPAWDIWAGNPFWWVPLLAALGLTALLWRHRRTWARPALFAWGYFVVMLMPVMGFTDVYFMKYSLVADHYQHLAIIAVAAFAAAGWAKWAGASGAAGPPARLPVAAAALVVALLLGLTWRQCRIYRNVETLFGATLRRNPECWMAHNYLGGYLFPLGRRREAMGHFEDALRIKPDYAEAYFNLGNAYAQSGQPEEAVAEYRAALRLQPHAFGAECNLGNALAALGRPAEAVAHYERALRLQPNVAAIENDLGSALAAAGRLPEAIGHYRAALRLDPAYVKAQRNLADALYKIKN